jgi:cytosine/adenosine deaminase-related metal-dependent hydrolase
MAMAKDTVALTARYVFPVSGPPLERGLVVIDGDRALALRRGQHTPDFDCGDAAIVPGFVNAHTHLDLTGARGLVSPSPDFTGWLRQVIAYRAGRSKDEVERDISAGIRECARYGTTLVGDIAHEGLSTDPLLAAPLRSVVFRELIGLTADGVARTYEGFRWWRDAFPESENCKPGVSPHAPYSVAESLYVRTTISGLPLATHLAETQAEAELLEPRIGPFVPFLQELGVWEPQALAPSTRHVLDLVESSPRGLIVHANFLSPDVTISHASVVYCPRTHAAFGHPPHPFREFLASGVRVALGTDSLASNPDLDVLAEARFAHSQYPDVSGETLLRMATLSGAEALGFADVTGSFAVGKSADLAIVELPRREAADPHELLFASDSPVLATIFRGRRVLVGDEEPGPLAGVPLPIVRVP